TFAAASAAFSVVGRSPYLRRVLGKVQRNEEILEQVLEKSHFVLQTVVAVEDVQRAAVAARELDALLHRHDVVLPAVHDGGRAVEQFLAQWRQAWLGER